MKPLAGLLIAGCFALSNAAYAQNAKPLKGVKEINVLVEHIGKDVAPCGITEGRVKSAFLFPLVGRGLVENDDSPIIADITVRSVYLKSLDICASSLEVEVYVTQPVALRATGQTVRAEVNLWQRTGLITSVLKEHMKLLASSYEELGKMFLVDWSAQQR